MQQQLAWPLCASGSSGRHLFDACCAAALQCLLLMRWCAVWACMNWLLRVAHVLLLPRALSGLPVGGQADGDGDGWTDALSSLSSRADMLGRYGPLPCILACQRSRAFMMMMVLMPAQYGPTHEHTGNSLTHSYCTAMRAGRVHMRVHRLYTALLLLLVLVESTSSSNSNGIATWDGAALKGASAAAACLPA